MESNNPFQLLLKIFTNEEESYNLWIDCNQQSVNSPIGFHPDKFRISEAPEAFSHWELFEVLNAIILLPITYKSLEDCEQPFIIPCLWILEHDLISTDQLDSLQRLRESLQMKTFGCNPQNLRVRVLPFEKKKKSQIIIKCFC